MSSHSQLHWGADPLITTIKCLHAYATCQCAAAPATDADSPRLVQRAGGRHRFNSDDDGVGMVVVPTSGSGRVADERVAARMNTPQPLQPLQPRDARSLPRRIEPRGGRGNMPQQLIHESYSAAV